MNKNTESFPGVRPFKINVAYNETNKPSTAKVRSHIHEVCEVYVNLTGDVSFVVEDEIYPIKPGDIIITRPFEFHHCMYHSEKEHKHFWILFSSEGNEELLDMFFKRASGEGNHLSLPAEEIDDFIEHCHKMTNKCKLQSEKYYNFFKLIDFLHRAKINTIKNNKNEQDVERALKYIKGNFAKPITIEKIAQNAFVSINTLERHFKEQLGISPYTYLQKKRIANAARLLASGLSVTEAATQSGFSDYSWFIAIFKKHYGITPFQYKKQFADKAVKKLSAIPEENG